VSLAHDRVDPLQDFIRPALRRSGLSPVVFRLHFLLETYAAIR